MNRSCQGVNCKVFLATIVDGWGTIKYGLYHLPFNYNGINSGDFIGLAMTVTYDSGLFYFR